jgi:hypothetical protein
VAFVFSRFPLSLRYSISYKIVKETFWYNCRRPICGSPFHLALLDIADVRFLRPQGSSRRFSIANHFSHIFLQLVCPKILFESIPKIFPVVRHTIRLSYWSKNVTEKVGPPKRLFRWHFGVAKSIIFSKSTCTMDYERFCDAHGENFLLEFTLKIVVVG